MTTDWRSKQRDAGAFTLVELLVVIAIVAMLLCLLPPVHARAKEKDKRISCLVNLKQIGLGCIMYAGDYQDKIPPTADQILFSPTSTGILADLKRVGIDMDPTTSRGSNSCWTCPNRPVYPAIVGAGSQIEIGYQYWGGITRWVNNLGTFTAASPIKTTTSKPGWMLAADTVLTANGGISWDSLVNLPAHKDAAAKVPSGANQVFIDGSARWIKANELMYVDIRGSSQELYIYQDDLGALESRRAQLKRIPQ